jgi:hypothetical protein
MTYTINHYDGTLLLNLVDGILNTTSTDLALVGKNYSGFGESINNNFVRLLENFASPGSVPPATPLVGQLWYDKSEARLKVWTATEWKGAGGTIVQDTIPISGTLTTGDIWIDSAQKKMYFYDGTNLLEAAKQWSDSQGKTATLAETIYDTSGNPRNILSLYVAGQRMGIFSAETFDIQKTTQGSTTVSDFYSLVKGFNIATSLTSTFTFDTTVSRASALVDTLGNKYKSSDFLKRTASDTTIGKITIQNDDGLTVGLRQIGNLRANGYTLYLENSAINGNIQISTSNTVQSSSPAIYIDATHQYVGIFNGVPRQTLDVNGNAEIRGNMLVDGSLTVNSSVSLPAITASARDLLTPTAGMIVFNTNTQKFQGYVSDTGLAGGGASNGTPGWVNLN